MSSKFIFLVLQWHSDRRNPGWNPVSQDSFELLMTCVLPSYMTLSGGSVHHFLLDPKNSVNLRMYRWMCCSLAPLPSQLRRPLSYHMVPPARFLFFLLIAAVHALITKVDATVLLEWRGWEGSSAFFLSFQYLAHSVCASYSYLQLQQCVTASLSEVEDRGDGRFAQYIRFYKTQIQSINVTFWLMLELFNETMWVPL